MSFLQALWRAIVLCFVYMVLSSSPANTGDIKDLCLDSSIRISNVEETGTIHADLSINHASHDNPCIMRIETCSACQIEIVPEPRENFVFSCRTGLLQNNYCSLGCDYLHIFDMYYMNETRTAKYYKQWRDFEEPFISESSNIFIMLCHGNNEKYNFTLKYKSVRKLTEIDGTFSDPTQQHGILKSPFFPRGYYLNHEVYEFRIRGLQNTDRIKLIFDDWHLDTSSALYYEDGNNEGSFTGASSRPSLVSETNNLRFVFHTGEALSPAYGRKYMGFKASYSFHSGSTTIHKPVTNCKNSGYFMTQVGGVLKFIYSAVRRQQYDCVWVVKRQPSYNRIYLKITSLKMIGTGGRIVVRSGLTSDSKMIRNISLYDDIKTLLPFTDADGFYIHMSAMLSPSDNVEMAFASYRDTPTCHRDAGMFECDSRKCISDSLTCDGYDHCGDNSDEDKACGVFTPEWDQSYQYKITIGVIIPMVISVVLVMVICLLFVLIRRCRRQRMEDARSTDRIRTLSEDVSPTRGNRRRRRRRRRLFNASTEHDNPPTYDEAIQSPPSWYTNVGFSTPVDPNSPQPPPYSEVGEGQTLASANHAPGSPVSSHSSQSEVTIDSRRHSVSSSSSDGGFRDWNAHESDTEGRRGRLGRHVSSSDDSDEEDRKNIRVSRISSVGNNQEGSRTGTSSHAANQHTSGSDKRKGANVTKTEGEKVKSLRDKDITIDSVVDSAVIDNSNKVGAGEKQGTSNDSRRRGDLTDKVVDVASSSHSPVVHSSVPSTRVIDNIPNERARQQSHAGMGNTETKRYEGNTSRSNLRGQRRISRSEGNLAQNQVYSLRDRDMQGTRHSLAGHYILEEDLGHNLVVDVDTNEVRVVFNDAGELDRGSYGTGSTNSFTPQQYHSPGDSSVRSDLGRNSNEGSSRNMHTNNGLNEDNLMLQERTMAGVPNENMQGNDRGIGRTTSVNYIPIFIDGNQEEDIYV